METKQTSVEWLAEQIKFTNKEMYAELQDVIEQAKQMEKEQIINTFKDAQLFKIMNYETRAEQYYNETYNN